MSTETLLRQAVKGALAFGAAGGMIGAGAALAQTAPSAGTSSGATNLNKIVVVGSHIPQTSIATSQPIVTITRPQIEATGFTTVGQILQNMSSAGASFNPQADFFIGPYSSGYENLNLKNLGAKRVLILVNGHRWAPTLDGSVDLSSIPASIIQRIEVLLDGASAVYGSDAISGVVNIITIKNFNGAEASAYIGGYDAYKDGGGWDGQTENYSITLGTSGSRGSVLLSAGYRQFDPIWSNNRSISKEPLFGFGKRAGSPFLPQGFFLLAGSTNPNNEPCFYQGGALTLYDGCVGPFPGSHRFTDADRSTAYTHYLTIPSEEYYGYAQGHFDITNNVTYSADLMYRDRNATQLISPTPLGLGAFGFWFANGLPIGMSANAPGNPFGTDLIPASGFPGSDSVAAAWCAKYGSAAGGGCKANSDLMLLMYMIPNALGHRTAYYDSQTWLFRNGFQGYFQLFNNQWTWNVSFGFTRNRVATTLSNVQNTVNLQNAMAGCPASAGSSCVPLDVFDGQAGITQAAKNYVNTTINNAAGVTQRDYTADLAGNFWNGWYAGPWGVAIGAEHLYQSGFYQPDSVVASGNVTSNAFSPTSGKVSTDAEYGELKVPFASNVPGAKDLSLDIANRWSQFRTAGSTGSSRAHSSTGRIGLKWQPIDSLLLRATWSQSFREPSISELFSGHSVSYNNVNDPCISSSGNPPPGTYNCPTPSPTAGYGQIPTVYGGNASLTPERAISRQVGFVWSPRFAPGLDFSADYYKVEIINAVGTLPEQTIVNGCYLSNIPSYCALITRRGPFMTQVLDTNINTGSLKTNGWDVSLKYRFPSTSIGQFSLRGSANFVKIFNTCNVVTTPSGSLAGACHDYAGDAYNYIPKHRMNFGVDWNYGPWSATWNMELIGPMWENCANSGANSLDPGGSWCSNPNKYVNGVKTGQNHLGTTVYNDVQASYTVSSWHTTFTLGVNNILDKQPPIAMTAFINNYLWYYYRIPGRFVYARAQVRF